MLKHLIVSLVCLSLWSVPSVSEADTTLRRKFTLGQVQKWKMSTKTTLTVTFGEQKHETLMTTVTDVETVCDEVAASGVAKLRLKVTRVLLTTESAMAMNMKLAYDTNDPPPTDATLMVYDKMYRPMIGQDTPMKSDSQGKLSDLVVPKKVRDSDQANSANMGGTTSEDWLRYMAETLTVSLPLTPIKVGGKWSIHLVVNHERRIRRWRIVRVVGQFHVHRHRRFRRQ